MPKLKLVGGTDNWWLIEKAEHCNKTWLEPTEYGTALMHSGRISDADVEGTREEMLGIAEAIEARGAFSAKRCAVEVQGNRALFTSPRNSMREGVATLEEADELAEQIRKQLA